MWDTRTRILHHRGIWVYSYEKNTNESSDSWGVLHSILMLEYIDRTICAFCTKVEQTQKTKDSRTTTTNTREISAT